MDVSNFPPDSSYSLPLNQDSSPRVDKAEEQNENNKVGTNPKTVQVAKKLFKSMENLPSLSTSGETKPLESSRGAEKSPVTGPPLVSIDITPELHYQLVQYNASTRKEIDSLIEREAALGEEFRNIYRELSAQGKCSDKTLISLLDLADVPVNKETIEGLAHYIHNLVEKFDDPMDAMLHLHQMGEPVSHIINVHKRGIADRAPMLYYSMLQDKDKNPLMLMQVGIDPKGEDQCHMFIFRTLTSVVRSSALNKRTQPGLSPLFHSITMDAVFNNFGRNLKRIWSRPLDKMGDILEANGFHLQTSNTPVRILEQEFDSFIKVTPELRDLWKKSQVSK